MLKEILTLQEAADLLQLSPRTLRAAAQRGEIPGRCIRCRWRFSRIALHQWLSAEPHSYARHAGSLADNPLWSAVMATIPRDREMEPTDGSSLGT